MPFKQPSMKIEKVRRKNLSNFTLPNLYLLNPQFERLENLVLSILKYSCPKSDEFRNFAARMNNAVLNTDDPFIICQKYNSIIKEVFDQAYSNFMIQGLNLRFKEGIMINPKAKIKYISDNKFAVKSYATEVSLLTKMRYDGELEMYYENWDDLLYDAYIASEYAKYIFTFLDRTTQDQLFNIQSRNDINHYETIISLFNSLPQTPGKDRLNRNLFDRKTFLSHFQSGQFLFPLVNGEIEHARYLATCACNMTRKEHDDHLDVLIKAFIFEKFFNMIVLPNMIKKVREEYHVNAQQACKIYRSPDLAMSEMIRDTNQLISTYKEPLVDKDDKFKCVEDVYYLYINKSLPEDFLSNPELIEIIQLLNSLKRSGEPPKVIGHFLPLKKTNIRKAGDNIFIRQGAAEPSTLNFLAPGDKLIPFFSDGIRFESVLEYANYKMFVTILELKVEHAVHLKSDNSKLEEQIKIYLNAVQSKMIKEKIDKFSKKCEAHRLFSAHVDENLVLQETNLPTFNRLFAEYLTDVKEQYVAANITTINNPKLIEYMVNKSAELAQAVKKINEYRNATIINTFDRLTFWRLLFKFKIRYAPCRVLNIPKMSSIQKEAFDCVKHNVLYNLTNKTQEELGELVHLTYFDLFDTENAQIDINDVNVTIDNVLTLLRTYIFEETEPSPRTPEELRLTLSIILNKTIPDGLNEANMWSTVRKLEVDSFSRILFMKQLHQVQHEQFFGPRNEEGVEAAVEVMMAVDSQQGMAVAEGDQLQAALNVLATPISPGFVKTLTPVVVVPMDSD
jgi:hypothetical protein